MASIVLVVAAGLASIAQAEEPPSQRFAMRVENHAQQATVEITVSGRHDDAFASPRINSDLVLDGVDPKHAVDEGEVLLSTDVGFFREMLPGVHGDMVVTVLVRRSEDEKVHDVAELHAMLGRRFRKKQAEHPKQADYVVTGSALVDVGQRKYSLISLGPNPSAGFEDIYSTPLLDDYYLQVFFNFVSNDESPSAELMSSVHALVDHTIESTRITIAGGNTKNP